MHQFARSLLVTDHPWNSSGYVNTAEQVTPKLRGLIQSCTVLTDSVGQDLGGTQPGSTHLGSLKWPSQMSAGAASSKGLTGAGGSLPRCPTQVAGRLDGLLTTRFSSCSQDCMRTLTRGRQAGCTHRQSGRHNTSPDQA